MYVVIHKYMLHQHPTTLRPYLNIRTLKSRTHLRGPKGSEDDHFNVISDETGWGLKLEEWVQGFGLGLVSTVITIYLNLT